MALAAALCALALLVEVHLAARQMILFGQHGSSYFGGTYVGDHTMLCRSAFLNAAPFYVDSRDIMSGFHVCAQKVWEINTITLFRKVVAPGDAVIEVGANIGFFAVVLNRLVGPTGRFHVVEAQPRTFALLRKTMELNFGFEFAMQRVEQFAAYSADDADLVFSFIPERSANNAMAMGGGMGTGTTGDGSGSGGGGDHDEPVARVDSRSVGSTMVKGWTLDTKFKDWAKIDLIKIDVEGAEDDVWRGMRGLVRRHPNMRVIMEVNSGRMADNGKDFMAFYREMQESYPVLRHMRHRGACVEEVSVEQLVGAESADRLLYLSHETHPAARCSW